MKITSFIPLIGAFSFACKRLGIEDSDVIYSLSDFKKNEEEFLNYFTNKRICYLDEEFPDIKGDLDLTTDMTRTMDAVYGLKIPKYDIITCVPPCGGLSQLNSAKSRGSSSFTNRYLLMCVKLYLATNSEVLCIENAPNLSSKNGKELVKLVQRLIGENGYKRTVQMVRTNTLNHGLPQHRERTFMFIHKRSYPILLKNKYHNKVEISEFLKQFVDLPTDTMNVEVADGQVDAWKDFLKNTNFNKVREIAKDKSLITMWQYIIKDKDAYIPKDLEKRWSQITINLMQGRSFWDESPYLPIKYTGAIIGKNGFKLIDPNDTTKFLTLRQLMRLMGMPEDLTLKGVKNPNVVCQNIPVNTAADAILWSMELLNPDDRCCLTNFEGVLIQNNRNMNLENEFITIDYNET